MAKFGSGKKPANQGSAGTPKVQAPKTSGVPKRNADAPKVDQSKRRGVHTTGTRGTNRGAH